MLNLELSTWRPQRKYLDEVRIQKSVSLFCPQSIIIYSNFMQSRGGLQNSPMTFWFEDNLLPSTFSSMDALMLPAFYFSAC